MGTRLKEETEFKPKPMVEIGENPILWHIMKIYAHYGFRDFILALGFKGNYIKDYFVKRKYYTSDFTINTAKREVSNIGYNNRFEKDNFDITFSDTGLETAHGERVLKLKKYINNDLFMVTYGDGVSDIDLDLLLAHHRKMGKLATVTGVHPMTRFGELEVENGLVKEFREKPQVRTGMINGGFFVFQRGVFDYLTESCSLEKEPLENLARDGQLAIYRHEGFWHCMDTYRDMENLNAFWASGEAPWKK